MFTITNEKVAGLVPRWAEFRGFSILFDNPGDCLATSGAFLDLACDVDGDPDLAFYKTLRESLDALNPRLLTTTYLFCPLPPPSYHVTVWDGGNAGNVAEVVTGRRHELESLLAGLPDALARPHPLTRQALSSPLTERRDWNIQFQFDQLVMRGALVARLAPTSASQGTFREFVEERRRLNGAFSAEFSIGASENYTPHVSLGYFANEEGCQLAKPCLRDWNQVFTERTRGLTLTFPHASLYGFTDMATFFKSAGHRGP